MSEKVQEVDQAALQARLIDDCAFDHLYGLVVTTCTPDLMEGNVEVTADVTQPFGLLHGGVYTAIAESLASTGTNLGVAEAGSIGVGMSNQTTFVRPVLKGRVHAVAEPFHRGESTWIWDVEMKDDDGRLCAVSRMTIAVRPSRGDQQ